MGDIVHNGIAEFLKDGKRAHINDQIVVTEGSATLRENNVAIAAGSDFFRDVSHIPRRKKLRLLDIDDASGFRRGKKQIRLPRKKSRNLQDVCDLRGRSGLSSLVNVDQDR